MDKDDMTSARPQRPADQVIEREAADSNRDIIAERQGDILGLGGEIRKSPGDHVESSHPGSSHGRTLTDEDRSRPAAPHGSGATSIEMGSGGTGTDLE